jgi:hypothetical protein
LRYERWHLTCAEITPSTKQNVALTSRSTSVLQPEIVTWLLRGQGEERTRAATVDDAVV